MEASVGTRDARAHRVATLAGPFNDFLARESLPIVVCCAFTALISVLLPELFSSDGWLALVGGRLIVQHGLPHHDTLTVVGHGRAWIDQQWLGQLSLYGLDLVGGVRLVLAANLLLVTGAFVAAVAYARQRGGRPTTVSLVALAVLLPFLVTAMNARTQSFAYLPFVVLIATLSSRAKISPQRIMVVLALLALWSNMHGSVLLAVPLVALRGALDLWQSRHLGRPDRSSIALLVAPWFCLFVSPYHFDLASYYATTAFNPSFSTYLSYWAPTTFSPISLPLLVMLFAVVWLLGRSSAMYSSYERWLLVAAAVVGLLAVRNWTFAALLVVMFAPVGLDQALRKRDARPTPWFAGAIAGVVVAATAIGVVAALARPNAALTRGYPRAAGVAAERAAAASRGQVYASIAFADWLMWAHPDLQGKVVLDARYELLSSEEVKRLTLFIVGSGVDAPLGNPSVYVLDPNTDKHAIAALRPNVRVVYDTDRVFVADALTRN